MGLRAVLETLGLLVVVAGSYFAGYQHGRVQGWLRGRCHGLRESREEAGG